MKNKQTAFSTRLFYSYSHKDEKFKDDMEKALALLKRDGLLNTWHDRRILPGQNITGKVKENMEKSDIVVFLLSPDFIQSKECNKEWAYAKELVSNGNPITRIPIILRTCPWQDFIKDGILVLPEDGKPISDSKDEDNAWMQVYEGIKSVITQLKENFNPIPQFIDKMEETEFISQKNVKLSEIFVFPELLEYTPKGNIGYEIERSVSEEDISGKKYAIVHGEEMSGKTALARYIFLNLVEKSKPALYMDLREFSGSSNENLFRVAYRQQFSGDYDSWKKQSKKTLILDNLSQRPKLIEFVEYAKEHFERIFVMLSSDVFHSFFRDEERLADFDEIKIDLLTHVKQESLIRKRLTLLESTQDLTDGTVDHYENKVNSIINSKVVPRYPFYVLSVLQSSEGYMPSDVSITSYGHCYYVLILAKLIKSGISEKDGPINTCFKVAEHLAYRIYQASQRHGGDFDFDEFISNYKGTYIISDAILNRIQDDEYGIISRDGEFKTKYMYYFFLGMYLSKNRDDHRETISKMTKESYILSNHITLQFIIHHTDDDKIIDNILNQTTQSLRDLAPATLDREETKKFVSIISGLRKTILSDNTVEKERELERRRRDASDRESEDDGAGSEMDYVNDIYRILKNNEVLGQVLRNKYGSLKKEKVAEIVRTISTGGLRVVNSILKDEDEMILVARYIKEKYPEDDIQQIMSFLERFSFYWTMINVEKVVASVNHPEIKEAVESVTREEATPAYDLIGYFSRLDSSLGLTQDVKQELNRLLKKHNDPFIKSVLSIRTQHYINTHRSSVQMEQAVCALLGIQYRHRISSKK